MIAEARKYDDPAIVQRPDAALRAGAPGKECAPGYANTMDVGVLPEIARATVKTAGFLGVRSEDENYYASHYGAHETAPQQKCVTSAGEFSENVEAVENFLYLLNTGNMSAQHLLVTLQSWCARSS